MVSKVLAAVMSGATFEKAEYQKLNRFSEAFQPAVQEFFEKLSVIALPNTGYIGYNCSYDAMVHAMQVIPADREKDLVGKTRLQVILPPGPSNKAGVTSPLLQINHE
jgi:hypothetical protein